MAEVCCAYPTSKNDCSTKGCGNVASACSRNCAEGVGRYGEAQTRVEAGS